MKKIFFILIIILFNKINYSNNNEEIINYSKINNNAKEYTNLYLDIVDFELDSIRSSLKSKYNYSVYNNSAEAFLKSLEEDDKNFKLEIDNLFLFNKNNLLYNPKITFNKLLNEEGNTLDIGIYIGYILNKINNKNINGTNIGISLSSKLLDSKINITTLNEYRYNILNKNKLKTHSLVGGIKLDYEYKNENNFYIIPSLITTYRVNLKSKTKFNLKDVDILKNPIYTLGANLKIGYEKKLTNESMLNIFVETGIDKKIKKDIEFNILFDDKSRNTKTLLKKDINLDINLGLDYLHKENNKFSINLGTIISSKSNPIYKINIGYTYIK